MPYTPPAGNSLNISWQGAAVYSAPAGAALAFSWAPTGTTAVGTAALLLGASGAASHGVAASGLVALDLGASGAAEHFSPDVVGAGSAQLTLSGSGVAAHGVSASAAAILPLSANSVAAHGVSATGGGTLQLVVAGSGAHGESASAAAALELAGAGVGTVVRFELRGEVRDQGVLVNRRVRAHRRSDGALIAEGDTVAGVFALPVGFTADEFYLVPINLDPAATDYAPPCANRVTSVLAMDSV